jgi:predicted secreted hydrolase
MRPAVLLAALGGALLGLFACAPGGFDHDQERSVSHGAPLVSERAAAGMRSGTATGMSFLGGADAGGFAKATAPRAFEFPADYGSHPAFRTEWWYYTGNLFDSNGRHFGFELTFFRYALAPESPASASAWATNQVYMAHFAVTDTKSGQLLADERLARGAVGLAGAEADPFRVWVQAWSAAAEGDGFRLSAKAPEMGIDLVLGSVKPPVPQGDQGLDRKGPEPGNASYYYSLTRLEARGTVTVGGVAADVRGTAWMDREWSTSALSPEDTGWDWFALQLSDGRDVMFYRLRRKDGSASPFSGGVVVDANGRRERLGVGDVVLDPLEFWTSEKSGARYPVAWRLRAERVGLDLTVRPYVRNQEIDLSVRYWEGAVKIEGSAGGEPIDGNGYLELAGY